MMSVRIIIKIFLSIQLLLLIFRQIIDFAGIQWLMIIVNAIAIIVTITAFFGYLLLYASFQVLLILYNIFVILIYARFITIETFYSQPLSDYDDVDHHQNHHHLVDGLDNDHDHHHHLQTQHHQRNSLLPSLHLLSFDSNSRSFWYMIVSNHMSNLQAHLSYYQPSSVQQRSSKSTTPSLMVSSSSSSLSTHTNPDYIDRVRLPLDDSLVDICVQYIEISIASLHILFSLLAIGLILLKQKLERDKLFRNNDKSKLEKFVPKKSYD